MTQFKEDIRKRDFPKQFDKPIEIIEKLGKGTFKYIIDGITKIRLYETDIVEYRDNSIILNSGGFRTQLTKNRINDTLPCGYIYQNNNIWYYNCNDVITRFFDSMQIDSYTGEVLNKNKLPQFEDIDKYNKEINKKIKDYCNKINKNDLPEDTIGDCFFCIMNDDCQVINTDKNHLILHLNEKYIMKSLIINALSEKGYYSPESIYLLYKTGKNKSAITRAVTEYFRKRLLKK